MEYLLVRVLNATAEVVVLVLAEEVGVLVEVVGLEVVMVIPANVINGHIFHHTV